MMRAALLLHTAAALQLSTPCKRAALLRRSPAPCMVSTGKYDKFNEKYGSTSIDLSSFYSDSPVSLTCLLLTLHQLSTHVHRQAKTAAPAPDPAPAAPAFEAPDLPSLKALAACASRRCLTSWPFCLLAPAPRHASPYVFDAPPGA